ncbi:glycerate kinase [Klebsiella pneumoniae]|uniref:Glycerate kinase n=1 Tax=Klebsiella pneumoniae TaxID=573 RepID=A0A939NUJ3_KLEPN|nr:glycerate kinase [Klebsiella pneumoniae]
MASPAGGFPDPARRAGHYRDGAKLWARTHAASAADVRQASSYGLGEQVKAALDAGCRHLIIGTGGSATNDGGIGFAGARRASGVRTAPCCRLPQQVRTAHIQRINLSGLDPRLQQSEIQASCDVTNPLLGEHGATRCMGRKARTRRRSASWRRNGAL